MLRILLLYIRNPMIRPEAGFSFQEAGHTLGQNSVHSSYRQIDQAGTQFEKARIVNEAIPKLHTESVALIDLFVYAHIATNPYLRKLQSYAEPIAITHYDGLIEVGRHEEANAIARIMQGGRAAVVNPTFETEAYAQTQRRLWNVRERSSLVQYTHDFLATSEETLPEDYKLKLVRLYDNVWQREDLGKPDGFPVELAKAVTFRVLEQYIRMDQTQYAYEEAELTGLAHDPRVKTLFRAYGLEAEWTVYRNKQNRLAEIRFKKGRIGKSIDP